jgi:hypothetical protein
VEDLEIAWPPVIEGHEVFEDLGVYHEAILELGDGLHGIRSSPWFRSFQASPEACTEGQEPTSRLWARCIQGSGHLQSLFVKDCKQSSIGGALRGLQSITLTLLNW